MRRATTVILSLALLLPAGMLGGGAPAQAAVGDCPSPPVAGVNIQCVNISTFQSLFPNPPIAALGQLGPGANCSVTNDTRWCTSGAVARLQSAVYAGVGAAAGKYAYVYQIDCTGGLVNRSILNIPWSGAPLFEVFGDGTHGFHYMSTFFEPPQTYGTLPTTPFPGNLNVFNLSEFGQIGSNTADGFTSAGATSGNATLVADSGVPIFWSGSLLVAVTDRPPVVSQVTVSVPDGGLIGSGLVAALVPSGARPIDVDPNEWAILLDLTPKLAYNPVGTAHTVTATLVRLSLPSNQPVGGATVRFQVSGANFANGFGTTNASGQVSFTYSGSNPGTDTILAFHDRNGNGFYDQDESADQARKIWFAVTFRGQAYPVRVGHALPPPVPNPITLGPEVGYLVSRSPGDDISYLINQNVAGVVDTKTLVAINQRRIRNPRDPDLASALDPVSVSVGGVEDLTITAGGVTIQAQALGALAAASCREGMFGKSRIAGLQVNGAPVSADQALEPNPNTLLVNQGGVQVWLNQQQVVGGPGAPTDLEVRALRVIVAPANLDITVGYARAGISCSSLPPGQGAWRGILAGARPPQRPI